MKTLRELLGREHGAEDAVPAEHERCLSCSADLADSRPYQSYRVCHACGFHFQLAARERVALLVDSGSFREDDRDVTAIDPLSFQGKRSYRSRVIAAQRRTGLAEAALTGHGLLFGREIAVAVLDFAFFGGSIGVVAGERLARAFEKAVARRCAIVTVCSTSGTRMEEGLLALMQMPRVMVAARKLHKAGLPHISIFTDPTTGFAYSGFVNLADYVIGEPNALVGYAALRVLQEAETSELPAGSHTSESHLAHGLIDAVVPRPRLRETVGLLADMLVSDVQILGPKSPGLRHAGHTTRPAWDQVQLSRHRLRPAATDYISHMTSSFVELRGDRSGADDPAIVAGFGWLGGEACVFVGQNRATDPAAQAAQAAWVRPEGFRKARRAMQLAEKFRLPVVTLIDSVGANPGLSSEESGLGHAMAECMAAMLELTVPTVAAVIGEANSEAAVAMAVADRVLMMDNAVYEVVRPEDAAKILFQEPGHAEEVAERLRITSHDCFRLGIIDRTVAEPGEGAHSNPAEAASLLRRSILRELAVIERIRPKRRLERRLTRYRQTGSTHSWVRGTVERRWAHLLDRASSALDRLRRRPPGRRRRTDYSEQPDIPV